MKKSNKSQPSTQDTKTAADVLTHIAQHDEIDSTDVSISVSDGAVTLTGSIDNNRAKDLAGSIASGEVKDVKSVVNDLKPQRDMSEEPKKTPKP